MTQPTFTDPIQGGAAVLRAHGLGLTVAPDASAADALAAVLATIRDRIAQRRADSVGARTVRASHAAAARINELEALGALVLAALQRTGEPR